MPGGPLVPGTQGNAGDVVARRQMACTYSVWYDPTNTLFRADSMKGGTDWQSTGNTDASGVMQKAINNA